MEFCVIFTRLAVGDGPAGIQSRAGVRGLLDLKRGAGRNVGSVLATSNVCEM